MMNELDINLDNLDQAAMILLSMGEKGAAQVMAHLDRNDVQHLSHKMARLSSITQNEADFVIGRFFKRYQEQSGIARASRSYLQKTLDLALGDRVAKSLIDNIYGDEIKTLVKRLEWVDPKLLAREITNEHSQLQAVLLGLLPPESAAQVLSGLPEAGQDELLVRIAQLGELERGVVEELRHLVERCMLIAMEKSHTQVSGIRQVADILNRFEGNREQLMEMIKLHDKKLAGEVADNMFDFIILGRQKAETLQEIMALVPADTLALALKGIESDLKKTLLQALPKRMSSAIETQIEAIGTVPLSQATAARKDIMELAKQMMDEGQIELQLFEEQVVE
ncbi:MULTISPECIES: flagellar motor switch protein FliG [Shewanella]|uniref:Flagellar motor switch protein FliG n=1 Tax=Shewanella japonica TaxID=93973 RepID=A0ABN4YDB5_9GAMM|nr:MULTISPECIES: flagellar motor switch protein FliG [Shewanella]ARD20643.1 Flagellar motor switch protein FliG [Shewanella japonica]KPZ69631.1 Flagellar motor switch protein FliG [Shewanella sp. P1-14-1]MBQ4890128.1 flagellar motor switch protein FliG [Shewanella sp. MMG014]OBT05310.1 flagellar motor switch protein FliG [Shewanella sp. UCD-FRSSP16_17]